MKALLPFCFQFEQENQRLVSEMNSLVDEVRSVTFRTATISVGEGGLGCANWLV